MNDLEHAQLLARLARLERRMVQVEPQAEHGPKAADRGELLELLRVPIWPATWASTTGGRGPKRVLHIAGNDHRWRWLMRCSACGASREYTPDDRWSPLCCHVHDGPNEHAEDHWILESPQ